MNDALATATVSVVAAYSVARDSQKRALALRSGVNLPDEALARQHAFCFRTVPDLGDT
jgi:hypothetical protein